MDSSSCGEITKPRDAADSGQDDGALDCSPTNESDGSCFEQEWKAPTLDEARVVGVTCISSTLTLIRPSALFLFPLHLIHTDA